MFGSEEGWERTVSHLSVPLSPAKGLLQRIGVVNADIFGYFKSMAW